MKKLLISIILSVLTLSAVAGLPQRRFSLGVNYMMPVGANVASEPVADSPYDNLEKYNKYWGVGVEFSYRLRIYRLFQFNPALSVSYSRHNNFDMKVSGGWNPWGDEKPSQRDVHGNLDQIEFDISFPVGVNLDFFSSSLDLGTGPVFGSYLYQKNKSYNSGLSKTENNVTKRFRSYWRFYAKYNFLKERFYAKVSFDLGMSHYLHNLDSRNQMVFGVGVNF